MGLGGCRVGDGFLQREERGGDEGDMFLSGTKDDSIRELIRIKTNLNTASVSRPETAALPL